jgi:hypothetical protein
MKEYKVESGELSIKFKARNMESALSKGEDLVWSKCKRKKCWMTDDGQIIGVVIDIKTRDRERFEMREVK